METLKDDKILKFKSDTMIVVRKEINLDKPGRMKESIDILEDWVKMQPHFVKREFPRGYLERTLVTTKGLIERAKDKLDKLCTFRTIMPEFFSTSDIAKDFVLVQKFLLTAHLPKLTPEHYRVYLSKVVTDVNLESSIFPVFYKYLTMLSEYFKKVEYCNGFVIILDYSEVNILNLVTKISPMDLRQIITLMTEGYGMRIKGIHVITASKMVDSLVSLLKQVFSDKLANRIQTHKTIETIYKYVPKDVLPVDYGGEEKSLKELQADWIEAMSSEEFIKYFRDMCEAKTNESLRDTNKFNENYIGMPGSFRALIVD